MNRTLCAALLVLAASPGLVFADTITVDEPFDDESNPREGSLRWAVLQAESGDTIQIADDLLVNVSGGIDIPVGLTDLTIQGDATLVGARRGGVLIVGGDRTTFSGLVFQGVRVFEDPALSSGLVSGDDTLLQGPSLLGCTFRGADVSLRNTYDTVIRDCVFEQPRRRMRRGLVLSRTVDAVVERNEFRDSAEFSVLACRTLAIRDNQFVGGLLVTSQRSGSIEGNVFSAGAFLEVLHSDVYTQDGHLDVIGNTVPRARVNRTDTTLRGNTFGPPEALRGARVAICLSLTVIDLKLGVLGRPERGVEVIVEENTFVGGDIGLLATNGTRRGAPLVIRDNTLSGSAKKLLSVLGGDELLISGNQISGTAVTKRRARRVARVNGLEVQRFPGAVEIEGNTITGVSGTGVLLIASAGGTVAFSGNTVQDCNSSGVDLMGRGATFTATDNMLVKNDRDGLSCRGGWTVSWEGGEASRNGGSGLLLGGATATVASTLCEQNGKDGVSISRGGRLTLSGTNCSSNGSDGVRVSAGAQGTVSVCEMAANGGAGVRVDRRANASVRQTPMGENGGPGIDLAPAGATENGRRKQGNGDLDYPEFEFLPDTRQLAGTAEPSAEIEIWRADGDEGVELIATTSADAQGDFIYPPSSPLDCPDGTPVTLTATRTGGTPATSEFSPPVICETPVPPIQRISVSTEGGESAEPSETRRYASEDPGFNQRVISDDGTLVLFHSLGGEFVAGDTNAVRDAFLRDVTAATTTRISVGASGEQLTASQGGGWGAGASATISGDGRFVFFQSSALELPDVVEPLEYHAGVLRLDLETGALIKPGLIPSGFGGFYGDASEIATNADGSVMALTTASKSYDLENETNTARDVYFWAESGGVTAISLRPDGSYVPQSDAGSCTRPRVSADGRYVAFVSSHKGLHANGGTNFLPEVYLRDTAEGVTTIVSLDSGGNPAFSTEYAMSPDARFFTYSTSVQATEDDDNSDRDVFLLDRNDGSVERVSITTDGSDFGRDALQSSVSGDGRFVAFVLTGPFSATVNEVWLRDRETGITHRASVGTGGELDASQYPYLTPSGRRLVFVSARTDLVEGDTNLQSDVFLLDVEALIGEEL